ncbi:IMP cyclohydrolase [Halocatena pleomorpha]|uniref:IMP cyclohydrolase n=1 Tax=Halocatena pleomorpha TaxID=1785090 RepID=A0A3P3R4T9_9EURY|nr:IMP cyclohydrolase [Halocatena pleomorpha]RRJ28354.1 IMP cyclohydrolase [Halocatena pleomorpha]
MYVGRFIVVAPGIGAYRVSSRSFPHRKITDRDGTLTVGPTASAPETDNPYIAYNCLQQVGNRVVLGNGSHVDPIAEKLERGYPARDGLAAALLALDYEKDDYNTPRIAGVVGAKAAYVGTVRADALLVQEVDTPTIVATYERDSPEPFAFDAETATEAARGVYSHEFEHPVCAAGVTVDGAIETAVVND